jgi:hypothetical protein
MALYRQYEVLISPQRFHLICRAAFQVNLFFTLLHSVSPCLLDAE